MSSRAAESPRNRAESQRKETRPPVSDLRAASAARGGVSMAAPRKALGSAGCDVRRNRTRILLVVRRSVANKSLVQTKGTGATGSFRLNEEPHTPQKGRVVKKSPKAIRAKRVAAKAAAAPVAKKSPKKRKAKSHKMLKRAVMTTRSRAAAKLP